MAGQRRQVPPHYIKDLHAYYTFTDGCTDQILNRVPTSGTTEGEKTGAAIVAPGADLTYRVERIHISLSEDAAVTLKNGTGASDVLWGPHALLAGFVSIPFLENADKGRTGKVVGENKAIYATVSGGNGELEVFGYEVPAK